MTTRLNAYAVAPEGVKKMIELEDLLRESGLEYSLYELVKMRASQINGCAFCLHMHSKDARAAGETEERLYLLNAWRESSLYTPRERAALAWTEALTLVAQTGAPDADYDGLKPHFTEVEIVNLTLLIGLINSWNRMAVGLRSQHPKTWSAAAKAA
jgi:AhpD family alkylhydroperoxidase